MNAADDSPGLSQEPVKVTWKWGSESTPIRSTAGSSKLKLDRLSKKSPINGTLYRSSMTSKRRSSTTTTTSSLALTDSPKGLFKFQEEMRKIQFDSDETDKCDMDRDTRPSGDSVVNPVNLDTRLAEHEEDDKMDTGIATTSAAADNVLSDSFKRDLLNDSDFDQMLVTCTESVERKLSQEQVATGAVQQIAAEAGNVPAVDEPSQSNNMSLIMNDESIDDILRDIDDSFIMQSINVKNSKMSRHKSMPQELPPQKLQTQPQKLTSPQQQPPPQNTKVMTNRKSFARHESMPIAVSDTSSRQTNAPNSK